MLMMKIIAVKKEITMNIHNRLTKVTLKKLVYRFTTNTYFALPDLNM